MLKTTDGGATWHKAAKPTEDNLRDVVFVDENTGWLLAERSIFKLKDGEARSYLFRTTDSGASWQKADFPNNTINSLLTKFVVSPDKRKIWAVGEVGALYSISAGETVWQKQVSPTRFLLTGGAWLNQNQGWLAGAGGSLLSTIDGGKIWREILLPNSAKPKFNAIFFFNPKSGRAVGNGGKIFATRDGGRIWREQISQTTADLFDLQFVNEQTGWIIGDGGSLLSTKNAGANWTQERINNSKHRLERLFFASPNRGWAVGFGGTIWNYSN